MITKKNTFEDLIVWKEAEKVVLDVYEFGKDLKDFWFRDQIQRASISVMNNIAEWYESFSIKDKQKFYLIAKWSCWEVRNMIHVANKL